LPGRRVRRECVLEEIVVPELRLNERLGFCVPRAPHPARTGRLHVLPRVRERLRPVALRQRLALRGRHLNKRQTGAQQNPWDRNHRGEPHAAALAARFFRVTGCTMYDTPILTRYSASIGAENTSIVSTSGVGAITAATMMISRIA